MKNIEKELWVNVETRTETINDNKCGIFNNSSNNFLFAKHTLSLTHLQIHSYKRLLFDVPSCMRMWSKKKSEICWTHIKHTDTHMIVCMCMNVVSIRKFATKWMAKTHTEKFRVIGYMIYLEWSKNDLRLKFFHFYYIDFIIIIINNTLTTRKSYSRFTRYFSVCTYTQMKKEIFLMITESGLSRLHQHFALCMCTTIHIDSRNHVCTSNK